MTRPTYLAPPGQVWPLWRTNPPIGEIVHILAMGHLTGKDIQPDYAPLPGGLFAEIVECQDHARTTFQGSLRILSMPASAVGMGDYDNFVWTEPFPYHLRGDGATNGMKLEIVPPEIAYAVSAATLLYGDDRLPIPVEDGWLC